jgi:hypothetical protein
VATEVRNYDEERSDDDGAFDWKHIWKEKRNMK